MKLASKVITILMVGILVYTNSASAQSFWVTGQGASDYWGFTAESSKISTMRGVGMNINEDGLLQYSIGESHLLTSAVMAGINVMQDKDALDTYGLKEGVQTNLLEYRRGLGVPVYKSLSFGFGANIEIGSLAVGNDSEGVLPVGPELALVWGADGGSTNVAILYTAQALISQEEKSLFGENSNQAFDIYASQIFGDNLRVIGGVHYESYNLGPNFPKAPDKSYNVLSFSAGIGF